MNECGESRPGNVKIPQSMNGLISSPDHRKSTQYLIFKIRLIIGESLLREGVITAKGGFTNKIDVIQ